VRPERLPVQGGRRADDMLQGQGDHGLPSHIKGVINDFVPRVTGEMRIILDERPPRVVPPLKIRMEHGAGYIRRATRHTGKRDHRCHEQTPQDQSQIIWAEPGSLERSVYKGKVFEKTYEDKGSNNMRDVYIVAWGDTLSSGLNGNQDLTRESVTEALNDAGIGKNK